MQTSPKKLIILSEGPVPTPEHKKVEGGGLRCWGLAKGIAANNKAIEVTVAYNAAHLVEGSFTDEFEGIKVATWTLDTIPDFIKNYDSVLVSYCMGQLSVDVAEAIRPDQQLILDCYVPIYVEVSARQSKDIQNEYMAFEADVGRWYKVLARGDYFLCANPQQKKFYLGVLSAVGRINPVTYTEDLILVVPYGIYREKPIAKSKPITKMIGSKGDFRKILWFGGIYPWFDLRELIRSVAAVNDKTSSKLIIVGAKNPFNAHPDFVGKYDELVNFIKENHYEDLVYLQDWVSFNDRGDWYLDSDIVVVVNKEGMENGLAWRTRLVDYMWADLPIITNGGDPLGEVLIEEGAAARFSGSNADAMASDMLSLLKDREVLKKLRENMSRVRGNYYWDTVTSDLAQTIEEARRANDLKDMGIYQIAAGAPPANRFVRLARKAKKVPAYARRHGVMNTARIIGGVANRKLANYLPKVTEGRMVFVSHQLDMSGAPFVLMDMVREVKLKNPDLPMDFVTFLPVHHQNVSALNKIGLKPKIIMDKNVIPELGPNDVVVLNTTAHSEGFKEELFSRLEKNQLKKLVWFVHEDDPELIFRPDEKVRMAKLMSSGKLKMLIAAKKMRSNYIKYFGNEDAIVYQTYKIVIDPKYHKVRPASDFSDKLSFVLPGTVGDGRKGQLPLLYAFASFLKLYYEKDPKSYRDFELVYVGIHNDFLSRQLLRHKDVLGANRFITHGRLTKQQNMDVVSRSNMTICYSIRECLPLFVFEGMINGHPILRNDCSGVDEQLDAGKNGLLLESENFWQVVDTIEKVLNKQTTPDSTLAAMSKRSNEIAKKQEDHSYLPGLADEIKSLIKPNAKV